MKKIVVFIPLENAEIVKMAMFEAGAGKLGNYDCCSFEIEGTGQFRPLKGSNPHLGKQDAIEKVKELRVEMVCQENILKEVIKAMKKAHPYEEVAFDILSLENENY